MVGEADGRGLLECSMRFPGGGEQLPKRTRLCGDGFSRKAKPRTAPYCLKPACAFRVGPRIYRKERACAAMVFRARLSRALRRIA